MNRRYRTLITLLLVALLAGCGEAANSPTAKQPTVASAQRSTDAPAVKQPAAETATSAPAVEQPTSASTTKLPAYTAGVAFDLNGVRIIASPLVDEPGTMRIQPPKNHRFVRFTLQLENTTDQEAVRPGGLFGIFRDVDGRSYGLLDHGLFNAVVPIYETAPEPQDDMVIAAGATQNIVITQIVSSTATRLIWNDTLITSANQPNQTVSDFEIDMGVPPAYTPPAEIVGAVGKRQEMFGIYVEVLEASVADADQTASLLVAPDPNNVMVCAKVRIGNPTTERINASPQAVALEASDGTRYPYNLWSSGREDAMPGVDLAPQKQVTGVVCFDVPKDKTSDLRVRFNPQYGVGNVVVPITVGN